MKFSIARTDMLAALSRINRVVDHDDKILISNNVLIRLSTDASKVAFTAVNSVMEIEVTASAEGYVSGATTVPAKFIYEIARRLPDGSKITMDTNDRSMKVRAGRSSYSLQTLPEADFPSFSIGTFDNKINLGMSDVKHLFGRVTFAAADDIRMYLTGVYLTKEGGFLRAAATDGHRLTQYDLETYGDRNTAFNVIVPRRTANEICLLANETDSTAVVETSPTRIKFTSGNTSLLSRLIDGKFPDYERIIPLGNDKIFDVNRLALSGAVRRVTAVASEGWFPIKMEAAEDLLKISGTDPITGNLAKEEIDIEYGDALVQVGFNSRYLDEVLNLIGGETVTLKLNDAVSAVLLSDKDDDRALYVLMPTRL